MRQSFFILLLMFFASITASAQAKKNSNLTGKWEAVDELKATGSLEFLDNSHIIVTIRDQSLPQGVYIVDSTKNQCGLI
jgi:hypothetical protein